MIWNALQVMTKALIMPQVSVRKQRGSFLMLMGIIRQKVFIPPFGVQQVAMGEPMRIVTVLLMPAEIWAVLKPRKMRVALCVV